MPHLAFLARDLLSVPGASHRIESFVSRDSRAVNYRKRERLETSVATTIIFTHENLMNGHL